jgi:hypothetical protein
MVCELRLAHQNPDSVHNVQNQDFLVFSAADFMSARSSATAAAVALAWQAPEIAQKKGPSGPCVCVSRVYQQLNSVPP